ncbi:hypothetical protein VSH64_36730 [Amycolatopsis rhabdoformis]|uniref:DUF3558 domain-containing protein n=1 Tax=Amycolatopsis rhabdoformis TaxID=1448059 RepID=A0ABZ1I4A2_9PSEU|nr:hypothetical protein [Amycolatopsis rhabdoformis]WSE28343.1 hypothetical protein VSH64_36730 [Amycolatopsis rhabdoformis]
MRSRSITALLAALGFAVAGSTVAGCGVAPAPAPGKPAPALPADSVAYDRLPVITTRAPLFPNSCAQFEQNPQLRSAFDVGSTLFDPYGSVCVVTRQDGVQVEVGAMNPTDRLPDPWTGTWGAYSYTLQHFRRSLVQDNHYYAVSTVENNGCVYSVNTGSSQVLQVAVKPGGDPGDYTPEHGREIGDKTCPGVQQLAETYLKIVDPGGGSLAG